MLRVLIIDDEPNVREGLKNIIDWNEYGFEVCGTGNDGDEGYEKIFSLNPDLVLVDNKMPGRMGIDVIRDSKKQGFSGRFIIVSGYSDFKYTKGAMKYGVKSYLLKPIDEDELIEMIKEIGIEIKEEKLKEESLKKGKELIRNSYLRKLMLGDATYSSELLSTNEKHSSVRVALLNTYMEEKNECDITYLRELVKNKLEKIMDVDVVEVENLIAIIFCDSNIDKVVMATNKLRKSLNSLQGVKTFVTIGKKVDDIYSIYDSYINAKKLMQKKFVYFENGVIYEEIVQNDFDKSFNKDGKINNVYIYIEINDTRMLEKTLRELQAYICFKGESEEKIKTTIIQSILEVNERIKDDYNLKKSDIKSKDEIINTVYSKESLKEIIDWIIVEGTATSKLICNNSSENSIKRVVKYVEKNYNQDLKLELLADIFCYNSAYLGKVFKNYTGESFNTYLDKVRIERAKKYLINDGLKVYQVCEKVGYKNIDYFHSKFKKYVGTSPLNYKKKFDKDNAI